MRFSTPWRSGLAGLSSALGRVFGVERIGRADRHTFQKVADLSFFAWNHSLQHGPACPRSAGDQNLLVDRGSGGDDVRFLRQPVHEQMPVADPVTLNAKQIDVRGGAEKAVLEILAKSIVDGESDDERGYTGSDSGDGDAGDDANDGLAPFGAEVASGDEEFEAHRRSRQRLAISTWHLAKLDYNEWRAAFGSPRF